MDTSTILWSWQWNLGITVVIIAIGAVYVHGWQQLHHASRWNGIRVMPRWDAVRPLAFFVGGLLLLCLVFASPINQLASHYFFVYVIQQLVLIAWVPCLLLVDNPLPVIFQGLPAPTQAHANRWIKSHPTFLAGMRRSTAPGAVWIAFAAFFWLGYDPAVHQFTLQHNWACHLQKLTLLGVATLYWWHITGAAPYLHEPMPRLARIVYTLVGAGPVKVVGLVLLFTRKTVYPYPNSFRLSGLVINDQALGGILIWILGGVVFSTAAGVLMGRWLGEERDKPALPVTTWATEEAMLAPGIKRKGDVLNVQVPRNLPGLHHIEKEVS